MSLYFKAQSLVSDYSANQQSLSILRKNVQAIATTFLENTKNVLPGRKLQGNN
jgi:DUF2075 family protein